MLCRALSLVIYTYPCLNFLRLRIERVGTPPLFSALHNNIIVVFINLFQINFKNLFNYTINYDNAVSLKLIMMLKCNHAQTALYKTNNFYKMSLPNDMLTKS